MGLVNVSPIPAANDIADRRWIHAIDTSNRRLCLALGTSISNVSNLIYGQLANWFWFCCYRSFRRPSGVQTVLETRSARTPEPFGKRKRFTVNCHESIRPDIAHLFRASRPATILRRVRSIIVATFDRMELRGTSAHVGQECLKRITPTLADCYSSLAVIAKRVILGVVASGFHAAPDLMFGRATLAVSKQSLSQDIALETPATFGASVSQWLRMHHARSATIASASPVRFMGMASGRSFDNCKPSKSLPSEVNELPHA